MSLRQQAKILGIAPSYLSMMVNGKRPWKPEIKERYHQLVNSGFMPDTDQSVNTFVNTDVKSIGQLPLPHVAHSSSGLGHRPLKAEITGSNPVCATIPLCFNVPSVGSCTIAQRTTF